MASRLWNPNEILHLEALSGSDLAKFTCVGISKKGNKPCPILINEHNREIARHQLQMMSLMGINTQDFKEHLEVLAARLLCGKAKHKTSQRESKVEEWSELIQNAAREAREARGGNTPMGESWHTTENLTNGVEELQELLQRQSIG